MVHAKSYSSLNHGVEPLAVIFCAEFDAACTDACCSIGNYCTCEHWRSCFSSVYEHDVRKHDVIKTHATTTSASALELWARCSWYDLPCKHWYTWLACEVCLHLSNQRDSSFRLLLLSPSGYPLML
jgi:hypothetical protein